MKREGAFGVKAPSFYFIVSVYQNVFTILPTRPYWSMASTTTR